MKGRSENVQKARAFIPLANTLYSVILYEEQRGFQKKSLFRFSSILLMTIGMDAKEVPPAPEVPKAEETAPVKKPKTKIPVGIGPAGKVWRQKREIPYLFFTMPIL